MTEDTPKMTLRARLRWWLYDRCFAYCIHCMHPEADPAELTILDSASFVTISKDEIREMIKEAPSIAWRFHDV